MNRKRIKTIAQQKQKILNKPLPSNRRGKKYMVFVKNPRTGRVKTIHFGDTNYKHNYSRMAYQKFMKRSAGIRNKRGELTKDNPMYANYWTRRYLWSGRKWKK